MRPERILLAILGAALAISWACSSADNPFEPQPVPEEEVRIQNGLFVPSELTISVGTRVTWINDDNEVRTVESGAPMNPTTAFNSPNIQPGGRWSFDFNSRGTFNYFSSVSSGTGRIIVQ